MRLTSIAISNIRSFKYNPHFSEPITFAPTSTNLIIGPNASGKSNLIEIVKQLFSTVYDMAGTKYTFANDLNSQIQINTPSSGVPPTLIVPGTFTKHRDTPNDPSAISFTFILDKHDIKNISNFRTTATILKSMQAKYASGAEFPEILFNEADLSLGKEYTVTLEDFKTGNNQIIFNEKTSETLGSAYLRSYGLAKSLVDTYNELIHPDLYVLAERSNPLTLSYSTTVSAIGISKTSKPIERPCSPVLFMNVQERLAEIDFGYSLYNNINEGNNTSYQKLRQIEANSSNKSAYGNFNIGLSDNFETFKSSISVICAQKLESKMGKSEVKEYVNSSYEPILIINRFLAKFRLTLRLEDISLSKGRIRFAFLEDGKSRPIEELSTGQRAIINIAATLTVGSQTQALVLIDEIENHLHPIVQLSLREAIVELSSGGCQVIAVTHSSVFVDKDTLMNTLRVYMVNGSSSVHNCNVTLRGNKYKRAIIDVVSLTKSARIFFANKVLLVEGMTDELFYSGYIRHLYGQADIEVISVGTKDQLSIWRRIIESFSIQVYTIADLDGALKRDIKLKPGVTKVDGVSLTWAQIDTSEHRTVLDAIKRKNAKGDFVLSKGGLESYYPSGSDKVADMYEFIQTDDWSTVKHKTELKAILKNILGAIPKPSR